MMMAGYNGDAIWGVGLDRSDIVGIIRSNPAQGVDVC